MPRSLCLLLIALLLALSAGRGMAMAAMQPCATPASVSAHQGAMPEHAMPHAVVAVQCEAPQQMAMDHHVQGLCCLACVALPLLPSLPQLQAAPGDVGPLLSAVALYLDPFSDPLRRPPRALS